MDYDVSRADLVGNNHRQAVGQTAGSAPDTPPMKGRQRDQPPAERRTPDTWSAVSPRPPVLQSTCQLERMEPAMHRDINLHLRATVRCNRLCKR